ncbi:hypothetical protein GQR58_004287 [Nymphon striatum]|nr:hypothetical protein GQR58_004287 [Nymphon striatum]
MSVFDKLRALKLSTGRAYRNAKGKLYSGMTSLSGFTSLVPKRLVIEPQDLHTADPQIAQEFYSGHYALGGVTIEVNGLSPFSMQTNGDAWEKELYSFSWLRHFSSNKDTLSDSHARALVKEWIELKPDKASKFNWEIETASKRLISLLCHSIVILSKPDHDFHHQLMRSMGKHIKILRRLIVNAPEGMPLLYGHLALTYASICFSGNSSSLNAHRSKLATELRKQILPDGGHVSRNPAMIAEILAFLLPLKEGFAAIDVAPPDELVSAIERLLPALRFFRHGDGTIARFNGVSVTEKDLISTLLRYDESLGQPVLDASHSGYQRANSGKSILIIDTGEPPNGELSARNFSRTLTLDNNGERLYGQEWFSGPNKGDMRYTTRDKIALRFHLHPDIKASLSTNSETCLLETREGEQWRFDCPGFSIELVESIFFATLPAPRSTWQIVIHAKAYDNPEINWALQKIPAT